MAARSCLPTVRFVLAGIVSLYQCDKCSCVENTALGHYHCRGMPEMWPAEYVNKKLCSACGPPKYRNGEPNEDCGQWHGRFKRECFPLDSLYTDRDGNVRFKADDTYPAVGSGKEPHA